VKIMTLNCGSSSVKYSLWDMPARMMLCDGVGERATVGSPFIRYQPLGKEKVIH